MKRRFLSNSGTEAIEGAIKLARYATGRTGFVAFKGAFHGRTYGALSLTSSKARQHQGSGPFSPMSITWPTAIAIAASMARPFRLRHLLRGRDREGPLRPPPRPKDVAAIFVEPVQGEGGYVVPPPGWLTAVRELCDRHGILMVADEVQCGVGRTGKMWACDREGSSPTSSSPRRVWDPGMPDRRHHRQGIHQHLGARGARQHLRRQPGFAAPRRWRPSTWSRRTLVSNARQRGTALGRPQGAWRAACRASAMSGASA